MMECTNIKDGVLGTKISEYSPEELHQMDIADEENESLKNYVCRHSDCNRMFRYRSEIVRHEITHTNKRPYVCPYQDCCKGFKRSDALATHIRIHTGDKPFVCPVSSCAMSFSTKAGLRYHVLKHKNDKLYKCDFPGCDQSFLTMSQLKQHKRGTKVHEILHNIDVPEPVSIRNPEAQEFEPLVQKRIMIDQTHSIQPSSTTSTVQHLSVIDMHIHSSITNPGKFEPETGYSTYTSTENPSQPKYESNIPYYSQDQAISIQQNTNFAAINAANDYRDNSYEKQEDQTILLKRINKVVEENVSLKKHLELCQKIIGLYQSNVDGQKLSPP